MKKCQNISLLKMAVGLLMLPTLANAAAFQLYEQNASGLGDNHAGGAAEADDASVAFYNSAGMSRIHQQQMVTGAVAISTNVKFHGRVISELGGIPNTQSGVAQGGVFVPVPFFHYVSPVNERVNVGLSVVAPFGLATQYPLFGVTRDYTTDTEVRTLDLAPSLSLALNKKWSVGGGVDYEKIEGEFDALVMDGFMDENHATDWNYGWHLGLLYQYSSETRIGVSYHSPIHFRLHGKGKLIDTDKTTQLGKNNINADVTLPAFTQLSVYHAFAKHYAVLASVMYTQWSVFDELTLKNVPPPVTGGFEGPGQTISIPNHFHNAWNIALGLHYRPSKRYVFRTGIGYDQTPSTNRWRNLRLPDQSRVALSLGGGFQATKQLKLDIGYTHMIVQKAHLGNTVTLGRINNVETQVTTRGYVDSSADLLGVQLTWDFAAA